MRHSILGFRMTAAMDLKLDPTDLLLLRWLADFAHTGKMRIHIFEDIPYYWIRYAKVLADIPIIGLQQDTVYRRFKILADKGVLRCRVVGDTGKTCTMYAFDTAYERLISDSDDIPVTASQAPESDDSAACDVQEETAPTKSEQARQVIEYFNKLTGKNMRTTAGLSHMNLAAARIKSGYTVNDLCNVIRFKFDEWHGTDFEQYVRPSTLFRASKFEEYMMALPPEYQGDAGAAFEDDDAQEAEEREHYYDCDENAESNPDRLFTKALSVWERVRDLLASEGTVEEKEALIENLIQEQQPRQNEQVIS